MKINVVVQGKKAFPMLLDLPKPVLDVTSNTELLLCLVEPRHTSLPTAVVIVSLNADRSICLQTDLDELIKAVDKMAGIAERNWKWTRGEYPNLSTSDMSIENARRIMIEAIDNRIKEIDSAERKS